MSDDATAAPLARPWLDLHVAAGAALGAAVGFAVPYFLHRGGPTLGVDVGRGAVLTVSGKL